MSEPQAAKPQMFPVKLVKNYMPKGEVEIVGYLKPEVKRRDAAGNWRVIEREEFIKGEAMPAPHPGVGYVGKIWAGTTVKLPVDEARTIIKQKVAERADDIAA